MKLEVVWLGLSAVAACVAAVAAAVQIQRNRADAKRQAAFAHIRDVEERLRSVRHNSVIEAREAVLSFYRGERDVLDAAAADYLAYLTALDLLLFACDVDAVDRGIAQRWLRGLLERDDATLQFVGNLQRASEDSSTFEYLERHLRHARHAAIRSTRRTP